MKIGQIFMGATSFRKLRNSQKQERAGLAQAIWLGKELIVVIS